MERDFLGLSLKESLAVVKEEIHNDGCKDPGLQWQFSNKASALSHLMSFKTDALMSSGFTNISTTTDAFDTSKKRSVGEIQFLNHDKQGGTHFSLTYYPVQHDAHFVHHPHDVKMFSVANQAISIPVGNPFFKNHFASGQNLVGTTVKQPLLGGIPVTAPHSSIPTVASIAGTTEPWNGVKASGSPAQLTIFYAGAVHVYDDITPEKAQAMMFLAGNGSSITFNTAHPKAQVQAPSSKLAVGDGVPLNQPKNTQPCSGLSSPLSVSSHTGAQSLSGSTSNDELMEAKTTGVSITPVSKVEPQKANVVGSVTVTSMLPSAVPQARKASLARFLEKRKERAMNAAPYNLGKNSTECTAQECDGANFASTAAGTGCLSESKESNHDRV
ncbi:protein TIFY 6B-like isoform X2 [Juglans microcarpa x Juglans regia]|uniref:protein TIFY 6B-like isoform X2 n=1 Tax=Juglans microcarpa x Juglans regia TaxID=2249226 RepID=UPI001B7E104C|nr:protein TIFY 6B-like isoform X2 [Juglans microcarpa x Juglans regia]